MENEALSLLIPHPVLSLLFYSAFPISRWKPSSERLSSFRCQEAAYFIIPFSLSQGEVPLAFDGLFILSVSLDCIPAKAFLHLQTDCD